MEQKQKIQRLYETVTAKIEELNEVKKTKLQTNGTLMLDGVIYDITEATYYELTNTILPKLVTLKNAKDELAKEGVELNKIGEYTVEEYYKDCVLLIRKMNAERELEEMNKTYNRIMAVMPEDMKNEIEISKIAEKLGVEL